MPVNIENEKSLLGAVFLENAILDDIDLTPKHFGQESHQRIFASMLKLHNSGDPVDLISATDAVGGMAGYLAGLVDYTPTAANFRYYAKRIKESAERRFALSVADKIKQAVSGDDFNGDMATVENLVFSVREDSDSKPKKIGEFTSSAIKRIDQGKTYGIKTGYQGLDRMTGGAKPGQFIVIAGRPGMGKSVVIMNIADYMARHGSPLGVFSLEMSEEEFSLRRLAGSANVDSKKFNNPSTLTPEDAEAITKAVARDNDLPLYIDGTVKLTLSSLRRKSLYLMRHHGVKAFFIDYLQLMTPEGKEQNREGEIRAISRGIKLLAKELKAPFFLACQLNRNLEAGGKVRKPIQSDLRESGALEQDADLIIFPWREAAYCQECKTAGQDCGLNHYNKAEMILEKQRNGPTGVAQMVWVPEYQRFGDLFT